MATRNMEYDNKLENESENKASKEENSSSAVSLTAIFQIALRYWYWFVISVIICLSLAFLIVKRAVPIYTRSCDVVIRDDAASSVGAASVDLSDIGVGMTNTILEDEMANLRSPDLMELVVAKLNLMVDYSTPGTFHDNVLYGSSVPVNVLFPDMAPDESASLKVSVDEKGNLNVSDIKIGEDELVLPANKKLQFGEALSSKAGRIIVNKSPFFKEGQAYEVNVVRMPLLAAAGKYSAEVSVEQQSKKSNVVSITITDASISRGDDILNELINCYNQSWINSRAEIVAQTSNFITDRLNIIESELGNVDSDISNYKSNNMIPDLGQVSTLYMQQSNTVGSKIMELTNQLQMARYLRNFITTEGRNNQVLPVNIGIGSNSIETQIGEYNRMVLQRNSHLQSTNVNNPIIVDLDARLASMRNSITTSLDNQILALTNSISSLESSERNANARVAANPRQAKYLLSAERQQKVKETLYLYLLQKREENELSQTFTSINTRMLRRPSGSPFPSSPKKMQIMLAGLLLGLLIPFGIIYARETFNTKIRGRRDLEGLNIPIVGEIPRFKHKNVSPLKFYSHPSKMRDALPADDDIIVAEGKRDITNEAFRVLRSNINFLTSGKLPCVMMITSFNAGSGKSFIAINTAMTLALKGKKVLILDGDMRRGSISRIVQSPRKGFANYLNGSTDDLEGLIVNNVLDKKCLSVLPVGTFPPNPTELLESPRFKEAIAKLRQEYDYIIIDCPPMEMMADAQIIAEVCDRSFIVVRVGVFERSMLDTLDRTYKTKKLNNLAVIINDADTTMRYGYSYRYGYGYTGGDYSYYGPAEK